MNQDNNTSNGIKERLFELSIIIVGLVGLLILFTLLFAGPRFIFRNTMEYFNINIK